MKEKIIEFLEKTSPKWRSRLLVKNIEMKEYLDTIYPDHSTLEQIYMILNSLDTRPVCPVCGGEIKFNGIEYKNTCSVKCKIAGAKLSGNFQKGREKAKITNLEKYGFESASQSEEVIQKRLDSMMEKYGSLVSPKSREAIISRLDNLQKKGRETFLEKYGVSNPGQLSDHSEKVKNTILEKYGVDHIFKTPEWKEKIKERRISKFDLPHDGSINILDLKDPPIENQKIFNHSLRILKLHCHKCNNIEELTTGTYKFRLKEYNTPCTICSGIETNRSQQEKEVVEYIQSIYSGNILCNQRTIIPPFELDVYFPDKNLAIEFNGLFYHNDTRIDPEYHQNKTNLCEKKNIKLYHIFEDEWLHNKNYVKNHIRFLLDLEEPEDKESIILDKKLESKNQIILENKLGFQIIFDQIDERKWSIFSIKFTKSIRIPLLNSISIFIEKYKPDSIIVLLDRRFGFESLFSELQFKYVGNLEPKYWLIENSNRIDPDSLTSEKNNYKNIKNKDANKNPEYLKIWDCGHSKWIWEK